MEEVNNDIFEMGDLEKIGESLEILGFGTDDMRIPERMDKINHIAGFLNKLPDPTTFTRRAVGSKQIDRIQFMSEYINLHEQRMAKMSELESLEKEIKHYED